MCNSMYTWSQLESRKKKKETKETKGVKNQKVRSSKKS